MARIVKLATLGVLGIVAWDAVARAHAAAVRRAWWDGFRRGARDMHDNMVRWP